MEKRAGLQSLLGLTDHSSKLLLYPIGRRGLSPVTTREDQSESLWAGIAKYSILPKIKDEFQKDRYGKSPKNQSMNCVLQGKKNLIACNLKTTMYLLNEIQKNMTAEGRKYEKII